MQTALAAQKTVSGALSALQGRDFSQVRSFLTNREGFSPELVAEMEVEYKRFVALCSVHATKKFPLPISVNLDPFWHAHLLYSRDYKAMCETVGHDYLHHEPASGDDLIKLEPNYAQTLTLYEQNFGKPNEKFWPEKAVICGCGGCACSGTGNE